SRRPAASMRSTSERASSRTKSARSATRSWRNLAEWDVHELAVGGPLAQALEPRFHVRKARPLAHVRCGHSHPALHLAADGNVAHGEGGATDVALSRQVLLQYR